MRWVSTMRRSSAISCSSEASSAWQVARLAGSGGDVCANPVSGRRQMRTTIALITSKSVIVSKQTNEGGSEGARRAFECVVAQAGSARLELGQIQKLIHEV